jgi:3-dehydro-L-gulonate 2-dehydrogenase
MLRIHYDEAVEALSRRLLVLGFSPLRAKPCAALFVDASRDGVYSHGLNRFPRFVRSIRNGHVDVNASPSLVVAFGALERWDGNRGPGNLNAQACMSRAMGLSSQHGIGCVALRNTNHWMRGGAYGWQAADAGIIGICWTNTMPNLPPWGAADARLGNNPLVIAIPRAAGHIVLDMAMSQFSYGALESYRRKGESLPVIGGFDTAGNLTTDPGEIEATSRPLPIGFWKGAGLALVLDLLASGLSDGNPTCRIAADLERETGLSQMFIALNPERLPDRLDAIADEVLAYYKPAGDAGSVRYPGEQVLAIRAKNMAEGIPVDEEVWRQIVNPGD